MVKEKRIVYLLIIFNTIFWGIAFWSRIAPVAQAQPVCVPIPTVATGIDGTYNVEPYCDAVTTQVHFRQITFDDGILVSEVAYNAGTGCGSYGGAATITPYLFVWNGQEYVKDSDFLFGYPATYFHNQEEGLKSYKDGRVGDELYVLKENPVSENGVYKMQIQEIDPEESYIDRFAITKVGHDANTELMTDHEFRNLYAVEKESLHEFVKAVEKQIIKEQETTDVRLKYESRGSGKLLVKAAVVKQTSSSPYIEVMYQLAGQDTWEPLGIVQPRQPKEVGYIVNIPDELKENVTLRLRYSERIELKEAELLKTFKTVPYETTALPAKKAINTRTGEDAGGLLAAKDQQFLMTKQGDVIDLEFEDKDVSGEVQSLILKASGFYYPVKASAQQAKDK